MNNGRGGRAIFVVGCAVAVTLLVWHADTLRLRPDGASLVWPAIVAAGMAWLAASRSERWPWAALLVGTALGVLAPFAGLRFLPFTPLGRGLALGFGAVVLGAVILGSRGFLSTGPAVAAFGVGVGATEVMGLTATTAGGEVLAVWTAVALAMLIGVGGAMVAHSFEAREAEPQPPITYPELPAAEEPPTEVLRITEDVYGPLLEPPRPAVSRSRRASR